jgi:drug/metabolite transporter (DMT)-like permease
MRDNDEWITGSGMLLGAMVLLSPLFFIVDFKPVTFELALLLAVTLPLEVLAYYLFLTAIRLSPLSLTIPLLSFTPAATVLTSWLLLGEQIGVVGIMGVVLVTIGAYVLNLDPTDLTFLGPLKSVASEPGTRRMLLVSVLWALTCTLGKGGVNMYGAIEFGLLLTALITAVFVFGAVVRLLRGDSELVLENRTIGFFALGAVVLAIQSVAHFVAIGMAPVAYMISVKRIGMVIGVIFGWLFFREEHIRWRLMGSMIMLFGVTIIYTR